MSGGVAPVTTAWRLQVSRSPSAVSSCKIRTEALRDCEGPQQTENTDKSDTCLDRVFCRMLCVVCCTLCVYVCIVACVRCCVLHLLWVGWCVCCLCSDKVEQRGTDLHENTPSTHIMYRHFLNTHTDSQGSPYSPLGCLSILRLHHGRANADTPAEQNLRAVRDSRILLTIAHSRAPHNHVHIQIYCVLHIS